VLIGVPAEIKSDEHRVALAPAELDTALGGRAATCFASSPSIEERLPGADLVVGAVLLRGARAPHVAGAVLVRGARAPHVVARALDAQAPAA
jgi:alanine dehydrogenase